MFWLDAFAIVAMMQDPQPVRDLPMIEKPCKSMRQDLLSIEPKLSVSLPVQRGLPFMAAVICNQNFDQESFCDVHSTT